MSSLQGILQDDSLPLEASVVHTIKAVNDLARRVERYRRKAGLSSERCVVGPIELRRNTRTRKNWVLSVKLWEEGGVDHGH